VDFYFCSTDVITTFHSFNVSGPAISRYSNIILIMSALTFFFNKNIAYILLVLVSMAHASNLIIEVSNMLPSLLECLDLLFSICYLVFVTEYYFDFSDKLIPILGIFFFYLVNFLLYIYSCDTPFKSG